MGWLRGMKGMFLELPGSQLSDLTNGSVAIALLC